MCVFSCLVHLTIICEALFVMREAVQQPIIATPTRTVNTEEEKPLPKVNNHLWLPETEVELFPGFPPGIDMIMRGRRRRTTILEATTQLHHTGVLVRWDQLPTITKHRHLVTERTPKTEAESHS